MSLVPTLPNAIALLPADANPPGKVVPVQASPSILYDTTSDPLQTATTALDLYTLDPSSNKPVATLSYAPAPGLGSVSAVQVIPSTLLIPPVPLVGSVRNLPLLPVPTKSKSTIAPVVLLTVVIVTVMSFAVLAPPKLVPGIVTTSSLL